MYVRYFLALAAVGIGGTACDTHQPPTASVGGPSFTAGNGASPSVTGHAEFTRDFPGVGPVAIRFSLDAVTHMDGAVTGQIEFRATGLAFPLDERWHGTVSCVTVGPDGKTARVGGRIDGTSRDVGFVLVDNGEGSNAPGDLASPAGPRPDDPVRDAQDHCDGKTLPLPLTPIDRGHILVRP